MQANQLRQEIHADQVVQQARKLMSSGFQRLACLRRLSNEMMPYIKPFLVGGT